MTTPTDPADVTDADAMPYMLDNSPAEFERVRTVAARRHREEAAQLAARSGGAQDDGLRARVEALAAELVAQAVRESVSANPYTQGASDTHAADADRLRRALAGPDNTQQDGAR